MKNIILIGLKKSGKTSVGKFLANKLDKDFIDTDDLLLNKYGNNNIDSISQLYTKIGSNKFREYEKEIILSLSNNSNKVISLGGGSLTISKIGESIYQLGSIIYLYITLDDFCNRVSESDTYLIHQDLPAVYKKRHKQCSLVCDITIDTSTKSIEVIGKEIMGIKYGL